MAEPIPIDDSPEIREQVARIAESNMFRRRRKLLALLEYLVSETMAGRAAELTHGKIAAQVFRLKGSSDPKSDAIVRISAARLRAALDQYFLREARPDEIRIYMPARHYFIAVDQPNRIPRPHGYALARGHASNEGPTPKKISDADMIGQTGINLIEKTCLDMGFVWSPTGLEAGIDGYIEIRHEGGEVTNCIIQVQSKATDRPFEAETSTSFEFRCSQRDLDYWLRGNAPVILVRSRPRTNEAYWVSLKEYFKDPARRKNAKIVFDKNQDRFDLKAKPLLERLAVRPDSGLYLGTPRKGEVVFSNLLEVADLPTKYYVASTEYRTRGELFAALRELRKPVHGEWVLIGKMLTSFHDLGEFPWTRVCDQGTIEQQDAREWALTDDPVRQRHFVQLLNSCLREQLYRKGVKFSRESQCYYFRADLDLSEREYSYQSREHRTSRSVFKGYPSRRDPSRMSYYRHSALVGKFVRYGTGWYLQITPTYHFTRDGYRMSRYAPDLLSGIKRLETNQAVCGQVIMWAHLLTERSLFDEGPEFLDFGALLDFELDVGLDDDAWLKIEDDPEKRIRLQVPVADNRQRSLII
jgi:hypothetical protein